MCNASAEYQLVMSNHVYGDDLGQRCFFQCSKCESIYLFPGLSASEEKNFYATEFEKFMSSRSGVEGGWQNIQAHRDANRSTLLRRMKYLEPILEGKDSILEVGCSSGFMIKPLIDKGLICEGVEPSGVFSEGLSSEGLKIYESIDDIPLDKKYDLIVHFFVLEHIQDPVNFLKKQISLLNKGGAIVFEIPNANDPLLTLYKIPEFEKFYWSIAHPWYFNFNSLEFLLRKLGVDFEIKLDQRYDLSNHIIWAKDGIPGGGNRFDAVYGESLGNAYKEVLIKAGCCDTLISYLKP